MQVTPLFPSFFAEDKVSVDNTLIKIFCEQIKNSTTLDPYCNELKDLTTWIIERANGIKELQGIADHISVNLNECWINCTTKEDEHASHPSFPHSHPGNWISFVYYVNYSKDAGQLVFMAPHQNVEMTLPQKYVSVSNIYNSPRQVVTPENGLAVAFSSWLTHYVQPNHSNEPRISIAYNFTLEA